MMHARLYVETDALAGLKLAFSSALAAPAEKIQPSPGASLTISLVRSFEDDFTAALRFLRRKNDVEVH